MTKFSNYVSDNMLIESVIDEVKDEQIDSLYEELNLIETELNEFLGLNKVAKKLSDWSGKLTSASDTVDSKIEKTKKDIKDKVETAKKKVSDTKDSIAKSVADKKASIIKSFVTISTAAKEQLKKIFPEAKVNELTEEQKATFEEIKGVYEKLVANKKVTGIDAIKIIALILAGASVPGAIPTIKEYNKQLNRFRTLPGVSSFIFSVKENS